jgi:hypothetical protein
MELKLKFKSYIDGENVTYHETSHITQEILNIFFTETNVVAFWSLLEL